MRAFFKFVVKTIKENPQLKLRISLCLGILLVGVLSFLVLASFKKSPAEVENVERPMKVDVLQVKSKAISVNITGYGQVRSLNSVNISAEVTGQVVAVHPRLDVGEVIPAGELLFKIDTRDYTSALAQAEAALGQMTSVLNRLKKQYTIDRNRLKTLERSRDLARAEFDRTKDLFSIHSVGTRSGVDRAEQSYNVSLDQSDKMAQAVALYPSRIKETQNNISGANARVEHAKANLGRCQSKAPFTGRITLANAEPGQYVGPGQRLVTLADDTVMEIHVPLDSRDVRNWLRFKTTDPSSPSAWFGQPEPVTCNILWTEDKQGHMWNGVLHRVVTFDQKTRTVTVAIRIAGAKSDDKGLPLVEGMFCQVDIPGRKLTRAFQIPRVAVSYQNTVFTMKDNRLKTVSVDVARVDTDYAYITAGLSDGDRVITTRLVDPLENALLKVQTDAKNLSSK